MNDIISSITLKDFKSFAGTTEVKLAPLTILAGLNSSGKSSVIQGLRICKNNYGKTFEGIYGISDIGHFDDILCDRSDTDTFAISVKIGECNMQLEMFFSENGKTDNFKEQQELFDRITKKNLYYVSAHRLGPKVFYYANENPDEFDETGSNIVYFYKKHEKDRCTILHPNSETDMLADNLDAWMGEISPGVRLNFLSDPEQDTSRIAIGENGRPKKYRATNVGFGISYTLPIVLLLLCSKPGDVLLIENPEAHIHPKGQSKMVELMTIAACNEVQVIVETHSDHIINGARVAVKKQKITNKDVTINFFRRNTETGISKIEQINVNEKGELHNWPEDFFDQSMKDLSILLGK
jgi:predicted ATPase